MSDSKLLVGAPLDKLSQKLASVISSLPFDKVVQLDPHLVAEMLPFLPPELQKTDSLFGLNLAIKSSLSMAHSGWLYSRYHDACIDLGIKPSLGVAFYSAGQFRQFEQFIVREPIALFLGFDRIGAKLLKVIIRAESQFDPNDFDLDGYKK